jgi:hypothetical protein
MKLNDKQLLELGVIKNKRTTYTIKYHIANLVSTGKLSMQDAMDTLDLSKEEIQIMIATSKEAGPRSLRTTYRTRYHVVDGRLYLKAS